MAGDSLTFQYRVTGIAVGAASSLIGGFVIPSNGTGLWFPSTGPVWSDNARSGQTPWVTGSLQTIRTQSGLLGFDADGRTNDKGAVGDQNALASNEVFSVTLGSSGALTPGVYTLQTGGSGYISAGVRGHVIGSFDVMVGAPSPSPSSTETPTPTATPPSPLSTAMATFSVSPSPSQTVSSSPTSTITLTREPASLSFPHAGLATIFPNPVTGGVLGMMVPLVARADHSRLELYSVARTLVFEKELGDLPKGMPRIQVDLPANLANGIYFAVLFTEKEGNWAPSPVARFMLLH